MFRGNTTSGSQQQQRRGNNNNNNNNNDAGTTTTSGSQPENVLLEALNTVRVHRATLVESRREFLLVRGEGVGEDGAFELDVCTARSSTFAGPRLSAVLSRAQDFIACHCVGGWSLGGSTSRKA